MRNTFRYPLLVAFVLSGCVAGERHVATYQRTWPAASVQEVKLGDANGSLRVEPSTDGQVKLVANVKAWGIDRDRKQENDGYFESTVTSDGTLRIGREQRKIKVHFPFFTSDRTQIDYELRVPATTTLDLNLVNGRVTVRGMAGEASIVTVNGPIEIETAGDKQVVAHTVNGHVRAVFLRDFVGARLTTVNGGVEAVMPPNASFTCSLSQINGDFEAAASFPLRIHSHPGNRRVSGEVNGGRHSLRISTVNGDVEVQQLKPVS